jgi:uncharacterized repeat protein (TIGR02543 family)
MGEPVTEIPKGTFGDISLHAKTELRLLNIRVLLGGEVWQEFGIQWNTRFLGTVNMPEGYGGELFYDAAFTNPYGRYSLPHLLTEDTDFFLSLTPLVYTITWTANGGALREFQVREFTIETPTIDITALDSNIHRVGHHFRGWYDNPQFEGSAVTEIPKGTIGDIRLYARWEIMLLNVRFMVQGEVWRELTVEWGTRLSDIQTPFKVDFQDWFLDEEMSDGPVSFEAFLVVGDVDLHGENKPRISVWLLILSITAGIFVLTFVINIMNRTFFRKRKRARVAAKSAKSARR